MKRFLGLDLGTKTLGVSVSDLTNTIATSLCIIRFDSEDYNSTKDELRKIIDEYKITDIVLGLPKNMNNSIGFRQGIRCPLFLKPYFQKLGSIY